MSDLICQKCGSKNPAWYADNDLFNKVNGSPDGVLCPMCFQELADSKCRNIIFKAEDMAKDDQSEIQRLTKEVERLNLIIVTKDGENEKLVEEIENRASNYLEKLTRLRELLGRAKEWIYDNASEESTANDERQKLLSEINELNPKP